MPEKEFLSRNRQYDFIKGCLEARCHRAYASTTQRLMQRVQEDEFFKESCVKVAYGRRVIPLDNFAQIFLLFGLPAEHP